MTLIYIYDLVDLDDIPFSHPPVSASHIPLPYPLMDTSLASLGAAADGPLVTAGFFLRELKGYLEINIIHTLDVTMF